MTRRLRLSSPCKAASGSLVPTEGAMKEFHVCGLGNAIVDIFLEFSEEEFAGLGFEKATMRLYRN